MTQKKQKNKDYLKERQEIRTGDKKNYDFGKPMDCPRCNHHWIYRGKLLQDTSPYPKYVTCTKCRTSVKLK